MMSANMRNWLRRRIWISSEFLLRCQPLFVILESKKRLAEVSGNFEVGSEKR